MNAQIWKNVKAILETALETTPGARGAFLDSACAGDMELRREVESLLQFECPSVDPLEDTANSVVSGNGHLANWIIGKQIGSYTIKQELGSGGMGEVFLAERSDGEFEKKAAIKFLRQGFFSKTALERFRGERQILAKLQHKYIAQLFDGGTTANGTPYLVMEYVEGVPITKYVALNRLSIEERLQLFVKVCEAVSYSHSRLIVHRDLKPDNILITANGTPKLLDFGIAKLLADEINSNVTLTRLRALTPEYASPEQILGENITTASDVYSLGIVLYKILTGTHPFVDDTMTTGQILKAIQLSEPRRPSLAETKSAGEETSEKIEPVDAKLLSGDIDNIVLMALHREPSRRYSSVAELSRDIMNYLTGYPVSARPATYIYRAKKLILRNPLAVGAVGLAFVFLIAGLIAVGHQAQIANTERQRAESRFNDVRELANSFMFEINDEIQRSPVKAREKLVIRAVEYLDKLSAETGGDAELESELATAYERIGTIQSELFKPTLGKTSAALVSHQKALQIRERLFIKEPNNAARGLDMGKSLLLIGDIYSMTGKLGEAAKNYRHSSDIFKELQTLEPKDEKVNLQLARSFARLGQVVLRMGSLTDAQKHYEEALAIYRGLSTLEPNDQSARRALAVVLSYIGYVKMESGAREDAVRYFADSMSIFESLSTGLPDNRRDRSEKSSAHMWLGVSLSEARRFREGFDHLEKALAIQKELFDSDSSNLGEQNSLADCYLEIGQAFLKNSNPRKAAENLQLATENYRAVWEKDPENYSAKRQIAYSQTHLATAIYRRSKDERALNLLQESIQALIELNALDTENIEWRHDLAVSHLRLSEILMDRNKAAMAREHALIAEKLLADLASISPETVRIQSNLASARSLLGVK